MMLGEGLPPPRLTQHSLLTVCPQSRTSLLASAVGAAQAALSQEASSCSEGSLLPATTTFSANERSGNAESKSQLAVCHLGLGILVLYLFLGRKLDGFISVQLKNLQGLSE